MTRELPPWATRTAAPDDYRFVRDARDAMQIRWPERKALRDWAKRQGWPRPLFGFEEAFTAKMLESEVNFALAVNQSGIEIQIPQRTYTISTERLGELDALYEERSAGGRPVSWGILVEELREIRRAVEAGVVVQVEDAQTMQTWQDFYAWAHGRYHMLEDGYDKWIGDDG